MRPRSSPMWWTAPPSHRFRNYAIRNSRLAAEIAPEWDLPTESVQSGLETLRSHLELVQGDAALLYEMT